jgi:hypothetical protein
MCGLRKKAAHGRHRKAAEETIRSHYTTERGESQMMWWIILGVLVVATVVFAIVAANTVYDLECGFTAALCGSAAVILLIICVASTVSNHKDIAVYGQQKAYIETHVPSDPLEDAALTSKKIELNDWLFHAQYMKSTYGDWSLYPDAVLGLEPIE